MPRLSARTHVQILAPDEQIVSEPRPVILGDAESASAGSSSKTLVRDEAGHSDLMAKARTIIDRRNEILREEDEIRRVLETERAHLRSRILEIDVALAKLTSPSADQGTPEDRYGAVPDLIRSILDLHPSGLTSVQIGDLARERERPLDPSELHSTLHRMVKAGELRTSGPLRGRIYSFAEKKA